LERFWNSRDGVTPFGTVCPSCGKPDLFHNFFGSDEYAPNHVPHHGQRVWIAMTKLRAEQRAWSRITALKEHRRIDSEDELEILFNSLFESIYQDGEAPDMVVTGYEVAQGVAA